MKRKHKDVSQWETEQDPVWIIEDGMFKPSPYFLKWWQDISRLRYGNNTHWLSIAIELGYVRKEIDAISGKVIYEPEGFDFDSKLVRNSLGTSDDMPIIREKENGQEAYRYMLNTLLSEGEDKNDH